MRATVTAESHFSARALSRSHLRRDKRLAHADWELGMGEHRHYGRALVAAGAAEPPRPVA